MSLYAILDCDAKSTQHEIRHAYLRLARTHHPDRGGSCKTFSKISDAWRVLGSAHTRHIYDASLVMQSTTMPVHSEVHLADLPLETETGTYCHNCRCGGVFSAYPDDLLNSDKTQPLLVPCDNCSLYIRILDVPLKNNNNNDL